MGNGNFTPETAQMHGANKRTNKHTKKQINEHESQETATNKRTDKPMERQAHRQTSVDSHTSGLRADLSFETLLGPGFSELGI